RVRAGPGATDGPVGDQPHPLHETVPGEGQEGGDGELRHGREARLPRLVDPQAAERQGPPQRDAAGGAAGRWRLGPRHVPRPRGPRLQPGRPRRDGDAPHRGDPPGRPAGRDPHGADGRLRRGAPRGGPAAPAECPAGSGDPQVRAELPSEGPRRGPDGGHRAHVAAPGPVQRRADPLAPADRRRHLGRGHRLHVVALPRPPGEGEALAEGLPLRGDPGQAAVDGGGPPDGGAPRDPGPRAEASRRDAGGGPMNPRAIVEAALFSAGKALTPEELAQTTRLEPDVIRSHLRALAQEFTKRESAIEVAQICIVHFVPICATSIALSRFVYSWARARRCDRITSGSRRVVCASSSGVSALPALKRAASTIARGFMGPPPASRREASARGPGSRGAPPSGGPPPSTAA